MKELSLHLLDIAENSLTAGATEVSLGLRLTNAGVLFLKVQDNGRGIDVEKLRQIENPFFTTRTTRNVGLGVPLLKQHAEMTGGKVEIRSNPGKGTEITARFHIWHPDIQPLGDLEGCWMLLAVANNEANILLNCETPGGSFRIGSAEVKRELELEDLQDAEIRADLKALIRNNLKDIGLTNRKIAYKK